ncbi:MAG: AMP-binding protein [Geobacteraceae bacterium]|nr:AMP-binding protein [Geobacteraceae bacterium]
MNTLLDLLNGFSVHGERTAIIYRTGIRRFVYSYAQLHDLSLRMNGLLEQQGVRPGDRVLLWAPNNLSWAVTFFGCIARGAIVVPVDFMSGTERAVPVAQNSGASLVIGSRFKDDCSCGLKSIMVEDLEKLLQRVPPKPPECGIEPDDIAELVYTSGTTGNPKGAVLTHRNLLENLRQVNTHIPVVGPEFVFLSVLPLSHMFEQMGGFLSPLYRGATIVYLRTLKPSAILDAFKEEDIRAMVCVPRLLQLLKGSIDRELEEKGLGGLFSRLIRLSAHMPLIARKLVFLPIRIKFGRNFVFFVSGGAQLPPGLFHFWNTMAFIVVEGYGLTECSPVVCANTFEHQAAGTVGVPLPEVEIRLENDEILVRGKNVFPGYYHNETATRETFTTDGWFRTGDLGCFDGEGNLRILGRRKELIVTGAGINVYPDELESVLNSMPGVRESCVIGLDRGGGEEVHAVLLLDDNGKSAADIISQANQLIDPLHRITGVSVWAEPEFPKTATLKIRKFIVKEKIVSRTSTEEDVIRADPLVNLIVRVTGGALSRTREDSSLVNDLGLTSIGRLELISSLEQEYRIDLDESVIGERTTVGDLRRIITDREPRAAGRKLRFWTNRMPARLMRRLADRVLHRPLFRLFVTLETRGLEHLHGLKPPVMFVANHTSYLDQPAVMYSLPAGLRYRTATAAWEEFFFSNYRSLAGKLWKRLTYEYGTLFLNLFPLSQSSGFRRSLAFMGKLVDKGISILVFPEGARSADGRMLPFQQGIGVMASELGVPLVPVRISGMERVLPRGSSRPRRGRVKVVFGAPFLPEDEKPSEFVTRVQHAVESMED